MRGVRRPTWSVASGIGARRGRAAGPPGTIARRLGQDREEDRRVGELDRHRAEQQGEAAGGADQAARVFSSAARRARSGAVTRTVSMRGTAPARGVPAGRAGGGASGEGASVIAGRSSAADRHRRGEHRAPAAERRAAEGRAGHRHARSEIPGSSRRSAAAPAARLICTGCGVAKASTIGAMIWRERRARGSADGPAWKLPALAICGAGRRAGAAARRGRRRAARRRRGGGCDRHAAVGGGAAAPSATGVAARPCGRRGERRPGAAVATGGPARPARPRRRPAAGCGRRGVRPPAPRSGRARAAGGGGDRRGSRASSSASWHELRRRHRLQLRDTCAARSCSRVRIVQQRPFGPQHAGALPRRVGRLHDRARSRGRASAPGAWSGRDTGRTPPASSMQTQVNGRIMPASPSASGGRRRRARAAGRCGRGDWRRVSAGAGPQRARRSAARKRGAGRGRQAARVVARRRGRAAGGLRS